MSATGSTLIVVNPVCRNGVDPEEHNRRLRALLTRADATLLINGAPAPNDEVLSARVETIVQFGWKFRLLVTDEALGDVVEAANKVGNVKSKDRRWDYPFGTPGPKGQYVVALVA